MEKITKIYWGLIALVAYNMFYGALCFYFLGIKGIVFGFAIQLAVTGFWFMNYLKKLRKQKESEK
jgi:Na+-driven multidrug efflux pump